MEMSSNGSSASTIYGSTNPVKTNNMGQQIQSRQVAEAVTNTVILEAVLGIAIVAVILTMLEVSSIVYIVFPTIKKRIKKMLQHNSSESIKPLKPLIQTLSTRETLFTERANTYIQMLAWAFAFSLALICFLLCYLINNEYRLQKKPGAPDGTFLKIMFWSIVTIVGISFFQGFGCIALGMDSSFCSTDSFAVVSTEWKQNENFSHIALSTGICDGVSDTESFSDLGQQNFVTEFSLHLATQIANQQASDPNTIFQELASDDAQKSILRGSTGVQERT